MLRMSGFCLAWASLRYASEPPIWTVPAIESAMPFPDPPPDGGRLTLEYVCLTCDTWACRYGSNSVEPDSLSVTAELGFPVWTLVLGAGVAELEEPELEPPHAATSSAIPSPSAASGPQGLRR